MKKARKSIGPVAAVRTPRQRRSRASQERLLNAAHEVLVEKGFSGCRLEDVSERSGVSIGGIYGRFGNKEGLIRVLQDRVLAQLEGEFIRAVEQLRHRRMSLPLLVETCIREFSELARRHADILNAFMQAGHFDAVIRENGRDVHRRMMHGLAELLLRQRDEMAHPDPERGVTVILRVVYDSLARYLGLDSYADLHGEGNWGDLVAELANIAVAYLMSRPVGATATRRRSSVRTAGRGNA